MPNIEVTAEVATEMHRLHGRIAELEELLRRARAVIPDEYEDEIEVRAAINRYFNSKATA